MSVDSYLTISPNHLTLRDQNTITQPLRRPLLHRTTSLAWSGASTQSMDDAVSISATSDTDSDYSDSCFSLAPISSQTSVSSFGSFCDPVVEPKKEEERHIRTETHGEPRQNPRRTSSSATSRTGRPPALVRQSDRKDSFVENLVDTSTHIVEAIWPTSSVAGCKTNEDGSPAVLSLRLFIQETLRRSRTSYSTLQVALYYLVLIKPHLPGRDFTMEQVEDSRTYQALQCGRRMFLAALILASKYLQDRNYSARAWSKISGLKVQEVNQNEMGFLRAVNWNLHITDKAYKRWAESVMKLIPTQDPASPGGSAQRIYETKCTEFRRLIQNLNPSFDNLDELVHEYSVRTSVVQRNSIWSLCSSPDSLAKELGSANKPRSCVPDVMEPSLFPLQPVLKGFNPALGLLPTQVAPQFRECGTPAVSATSQLLGGRSSMGFAMAQVSSSATTQALDRWPGMNTSPVRQLTRRSSLANSVSLASSPESMVSDSSRYSRSSSISSSYSVAAPSSTSDVQARIRYSKSGERLNLMPTIAAVPEDYEENCLTASPESYMRPMEKDLCDAALVDDAARTLQGLHRQGANYSAARVKTGSKRSRTFYSESSLLQENVRGLLAGDAEDAFSHKRLCCSREMAQHSIMSTYQQQPALGIVGPGMWDGILS
ncbi:hypothetical protein QBC35DRAFT_385129 [Podospora australis]|uniref:G1/S-specific cyclin pas1 n=1 Tax=Podospora australis TaxID=1536484 RepID=A0AAN6WS37_9PEZI|nr:hypothetical protein QBC35DRAFT_385129 [Podospora australis]